jgi:hypothetical protein
MLRVQRCVQLLVISIVSKWGIKICKSAHSHFTQNCSLYDNLYLSKSVLINKRSTTFSKTADKKTILNTWHGREQDKNLITPTAINTTWVFKEEKNTIAYGIDRNNKKICMSGGLGTLTLHIQDYKDDDFEENK